jgi:hypothetical protein
MLYCLFFVVLSLGKRAPNPCKSFSQLQNQGDDYTDIFLKNQLFMT